MLIIVAIAVVIVVYFAFFAGKDSGVRESFQEAITQTESLVNEDTEVTASVRNKYVVPAARGRIAHMVVFACDDGAEREYALDKEIFDALFIDQRDTLIFSGAMFLGFGAYGGTDIEDDAGAISHDDAFSNEDFDETIDIEQIPDLEQAYTDTLGVEDKQALERFLNYEKLPPKSEVVADDPDTFAMYRTDRLLQKLTVYPFLKREEKIARMFERVYVDALEDMRGYDGNARRGMAADDMLLNGNEIRLVITVQEAPPPLRCSVNAEVGVND